MTARWAWRRAKRAEGAAQDARREAETSRQRLAHFREHIVEPIRAAGERNQFAAMIADSLREGHPK